MTELRNLEIMEVSFVDAGANPEAKINLFKRKTRPEPDLITADLTELRQLTTSLKKTLQTAQDKHEVESLRKYEILGTRAEKLQTLLKAAKAAGGKLYAETLATLEEALGAVEKSGTFSELGKSGSGTADVESLAKTYQKRRPNMSWREALDKAYRSQLGG